MAAIFLPFRSASVRIESFGRPPIQTWLPLAVHAGHSAPAMSIYREELPVGEGVDLAELSAAETERNARVATRDDVVVSLVGLDAFNWKLARFTLSSAPLRAIEGVVGYEIAYLAAPGLARLRELTAHAVPTTPLSSTHA